MSHDSIERPGKNEQVHTRDGKWYMRLDDTGDGAEIPSYIATNIKGLLASNNRSGVITNVNCHTAAFAALGLTNIAPEIDKKISNALFVVREGDLNGFGSAEEFTEHLKRSLGTSMGIVQGVYPGVKDASENLRHSFLAALDESGRYVCFEKEDFGKPFQIVPLEDIYDRDTYRQLWAARKVEDLLEGPHGEEIRARILEQ